MKIAEKVHTSVDAEKRANLAVSAGDTVRVSIRIEEKGKTRTQDFEGIVLAKKHGNEAGATITVRRTTGGIGVEKIFPLFSPVIEKIEVIKRSKVRQSNLYHIRKKAEKEVRRHMKNTIMTSETDLDQESSADEVTEEEVSPETENDSGEVGESLNTQEDSKNEEAKEEGKVESNSSEEVKEETKKKEEASEKEEGGKSK